MYAIGAKICYVKTQWSANVEQRFVSRGHIVTKVGKSEGQQTIWIDNQHKAEDCLYAVFTYPDTDECVAFQQFDLDRTAKRKQEDNERMKQMYKFNNDLIRRGLK